MDIDQALLGIDKLLKSQELTFAFAGVAPAPAIVYDLFILGVIVSAGVNGAEGKRGEVYGRAYGK